MSASSRPVASSLVRRPVVGVVARVLIETALAGHLVVAAFYWWLSPKGFPVHHSRFWLNSVVPLAVVAATLVGLAGVLQQRRRIAGLVVACIASAWFAAAISGRVSFPFSLRGFWTIGLVAALLAAGWSTLLLRTEQRSTKAWLACTWSLGAVGSFVVWAQIPPTPATKPFDEFKPTRPESRDEQVSCFGVEDRRGPSVLSRDSGVRLEAGRRDNSLLAAAGFRPRFSRWILVNPRTGPLERQESPAAHVHAWQFHVFAITTGR